MKILQKLFRREVKNEDAEEEIRIAKIIGPMLDNITDDIFSSYVTELLAESPTYIVPAVWGAKKDGELTAYQREMNEKIAPVINEIIEKFEFRGLRNDQAFAIGYLIRGLFISKITYMIEVLKNKSNIEYKHEDSANNMLNFMKPIGNA